MRIARLGSYVFRDRNVKARKLILRKGDENVEVFPVKKAFWRCVVRV